MPSRHPAPFDCYALNVSGIAAWACPYTDFPLVEIHPNRPERPVRGVGEPRTKRGRTISARSPAIPRTLPQRAWRGASTVTSSPVRTRRMFGRDPAASPHGAPHSTCHSNTKPLSAPELLQGHAHPQSAPARARYGGPAADGPQDDVRIDHCPPGLTCPAPSRRTTRLRLLHTPIAEHSAQPPATASLRATTPRPPVEPRPPAVHTPP